MPLLSALLLAALPPQTARGVVVDAFDLEPVSGAAVEVWTEETTAATGGFFRIDAALSGPDGRFLVALVVDDIAGEKVRVSRPGYLTLSTTASELAHSARLALFPAEPRAPRLRVLDAEDRPLAGVRVTSTFSCAHDVPALDVRTDEHGLARLAGFGLQENVPDLRLRAPGHAAIEYLSPNELLRRTPGARPFTVRLPRQRPAHLRLLDRQGDPLAGVSVHLHDGEGEHVLRTDLEGRLAVEARYGRGDLTLSLLGSGGKEWIGSVLPHAGRETVMRIRPEEWPDELLRGRLRVDPGAAADARVWLRHADGWSWTGRVDPDEPRELPIGTWTLTLGGAFRGWAPLELTFEIAPGAELGLNLEPEREPAVRVLAPEGTHTLWIQAVDVTLEDVRADEPVTVPANRPLIVFAHGPDGPRRLRVDRGLDGATLDLRRPEARIEPATLTATDPVETGSVRFTPGASALAGGRLRLANEWSGCALAEERGPDGALLSARLTGPVGAPWLLEVPRAEGTSTWLRGRIGPRAERRTLP